MRKRTLKGSSPDPTGVLLYMSTTTNQEVAKTILSQLGGSGRLSAMIGAHTFTSGANSLSFKIKARAKNGIKGIRITLDPSDTYTVEFLAIRGLNVKSDAVPMVYCDSLKSLIESKTGLYLSL